MIIEVTSRNITTGPTRSGKITDGSGEDTFHVSFDPEDDPIVDTLVTAVSAIHNEPTHELEPLAHTIDPALLERLVTDSPDGMTSGEVSFRYEGLSIKVAGDGDIYMEWI